MEDKLMDMLWKTLGQMTHMKSEMNERFDAMDACFNKLDETLFLSRLLS